MNKPVSDELIHFNHGFIVFDLETTDDENNRRIIQVGAIKLDPWLQIEGTFYRLVNPEVEVSDFVLELTGTRKEELDKAFTIEKVVSEFEAWVGNIKKQRLAAWGNYFDINVLRNEYKRINRPYPFSGTVLDVKTLALTYLAISGQRTDKKCSLQGVVENLGLSTSNDNAEHRDTYHDAHFDAWQTARVLKELLPMFKSSVWFNKQRFLVNQPKQKAGH